jgi:hypothetical protein
MPQRTDLIVHNAPILSGGYLCVRSGSIHIALTVRPKDA